MDLEELQESDVMFFSDYSWDRHRHGHSKGRSLSSSLNLPRNGKREKQQRMRSPISTPVNIPNGTGIYRYDIDLASREPSDQSSSDEDLDDDEDEITGRLPPHLIVQRRESGEIVGSFSPLKGRHLSQVRNSVLRMTGFLEG